MIFSAANRSAFVSCPCGWLLFGPTVAIVSACGLAPGQKYQVFIAIKSSDSKGIVLELVEINATCKSWRKMSITIKKSDRSDKYIFKITEK